MRVNSPKHKPANQLSRDRLEFLKQVDKLDDLAAVLLATDYLDRALYHVLTARLVDPAAAKEEVSRARFARRVTLAFLVGIVGPVMFNDLKVIVDIRNRFAHRYQPLALSDPEITELCCGLQTVALGNPEVSSDPRRAFLESVVLLTGYLTEQLTRTERLPLGPDFRVITTDAPAAVIVAPKPEPE